MTTRAKWFGALIGAATISSMAVTSVATTAQAASANKAHAAKATKKTLSGAACKKRNKATGTIKFSDWEFPDTLSPYQTTMATTSYVENSMFDGLWTYDSKARFHLQMATQLPSLKNGGIKNGGKTITVHIKKGLHWSNGAAITSKDIVFGWHVGMNKATGPACSGTCDVISRIATPDKYTAVMHLKQVYAPFLAYGTPPIWPSKWAGAWNNDANAAANKLAQDTAFNFETADYPTNGAYQISQFVKDDRIVLTPMKHYTVQNCGGYVKTLIFSFYSNKAAMIAAAANHDTDVTGGGGGYTVADLPALTQNKSAYRLYAGAGFGLEHVEYNLDSTFNGKPNPLANTNVRLAMNLALDKLGLIRSALGVSKTTAQNIVGWTPWVNTPQLKQPYADRSVTGQWDPYTKKYVLPGTAAAVKDAKKLMAKTPYASGTTLDFYTTTGNPVRTAEANIMQANWSKIGIKLNLNFVPAGTLFADWAHNGTLQHGTFQVGMWGYTGSPDPDQWHFNFQSKYIDRRVANHVPQNENEAGIDNPAINKAFTAAAHSLDPKVRAKNYYLVQRQMNQKAYWNVLYFRPAIATADTKVQNFSNNPTQVGPTWNVANWKVKGSS